MDVNGFPLFITWLVEVWVYVGQCNFFFFLRGLEKKKNVEVFLVSSPGLIEMWSIGLVDFVRVVEVLNQMRLDWTDSILRKDHCVLRERGGERWRNILRLRYFLKTRTKTETCRRTPDRRWCTRVYVVSIYKISVSKRDI